MSNMNVGAVSRNRVTGLMSGMDIDEVVRGMVSGHQNRLDRANQQRDLIGWRKDAFRGAVTKLTNFQNRFLDIMSPNSILRPSNFRTQTARLSNEAMSRYFTVSGSEVSTGGFTVNSISQLATAQRIESIGGTNGRIELANLNPENITRLLAGTPPGNAPNLTLNFTVNGETRAISFTAEDAARSTDVNGHVDMGAFTNVLNERLASAFGRQNVNGVDVPKLRFNVEDILTDAGTHSGRFNLTLDVAPGNMVSLSAPSASAGALGISGTLSNHISPNQTIGALLPAGQSQVRFSINGVVFNVSADTTINDVMRAVNSSEAGVTMSYSPLNDRFSIVSNRMGSGDNIILQDLGVGTNNATPSTFFESVFGTSGGEVDPWTGEASPVVIGSVTQGQDAVLQVNGIDIVRASNDITIEGITVTLARVTTNSTDFAPTSVTATSDPTRTIDAIREFVDAYNELIEELSNMVSERRPRSRGSFFMPLTSAQREEMSESEITQWEEEGRKGLLNGDQDLTRIVSSLRSAMMSPVRLADGRSVSLVSIGIQSANFFEDRTGRLQIDEDRLREAILNDPQMVEALFMQQSVYSRAPRFDGTNARAVDAFPSRYFTEIDENGRQIPDRHGNIIRSAADYQRAFFNSQGFGRRFEDIFTSAVNVSTNVHLRGSLIRTAGTGGANTFVDNTSILQQQVDRQDTIVERVQRRMQEAEDRHFMQFARLETALARLSRQSAFLGMGME